MNRLHAFLRKLGAAGVLGLGVLFFCIPFYFSALRRNSSYWLSAATGR